MNAVVVSPREFASAAILGTIVFAPLKDNGQFSGLQTISTRLRAVESNRLRNC